MGKRKGKGKRGVSARRRQRPSARDRGGMRGRVRGPGKACAAGCAARGQWRVRPALIAVGGRAMRLWREKRERERGPVGEKEKVTSTNGIGSWESGIRDREKIFRDLGFGFLGCS